MITTPSPGEQSSPATAPSSPNSSKSKVKVLLVDDHPVVRQGLSALLTMEKDIEVVGEAENGRAAVGLVSASKPDVVVMDVSMPLLNGIEATRQIVKAAPAAKVLVLSSYADDEFVERSLWAGASGFLAKDSAAADLVRAIRAVHNGNRFLGSSVAKRLGHRFPEQLACNGPAHPGSELTSRQVEVLQLIAEGFPNKQIASELGISVKTVEKHRQSLMHLLRVHDVAGLTRCAVALGLVECSQGINLGARTADESGPSRGS